MINVPINPSQARAFTAPGSVGYTAANDTDDTSSGTIRSNGLMGGGGPDMSLLSSSGKDTMNSDASGIGSISSVSGIVPVLQ